MGLRGYGTRGASRWFWAEMVTTFGQSRSPLLDPLDPTRLKRVERFLIKRETVCETESCLCHCRGEFQKTVFDVPLGISGVFVLCLVVFC